MTPLPVHNPEFDLIRASHFSLKDDRAISLKNDVLALMPDLLLDVTGDVQRDESNFDYITGFQQPDL